MGGQPEGVLNRRGQGSHGLASHLGAGPLGEHPQPFTDHGQDGGEVGQAEHDPQPHQRLQDDVAVTA